MSNTTFVTRFAPSPTGYLHVGGARTALFNWLAARHAGGKFLLRIEDTDLARSTQQATDQLLEDLGWLGLHWDNPELVFQSQRLHLYNGAIENLLSRGQAYKAYETIEQLEAERNLAETRKRAFIYRRPQLTDGQIRQYQSERRPHVVRLAMPVKQYSFHDVVLGKDITLGPDEAQDFIIRKADGMPTYHFAVVVDDADMNVTHVLRGQEHTKNTFYHLALQEALGYPRPVYGHLPIILNLDGSKMGKRDRDKKIRHHANLWLKNTKQTSADLSAACGLAVQRLAAWLANPTTQLDPTTEHPAVMKVVGLTELHLPEILVHDFRKNGYLPEVLLNFLALLGWSPGGDKERMTIDQMISLFGIHDIGKSNAKFDRDKLLAFNTEACASAPPQRLLAAMKDFLASNPPSPLNDADDAQLLRVLKIKPGFHVLRELEQQSRFFFLPDEQIIYDQDAVEKVLRKNNAQGLTALREISQVLQTLTQWTAQTLEAALNQYCQQKQLALGKVAQPIRLAICGTTISPPIFQSLEFLGKQRTLNRIDICLRLVQ